MPQLTLSQLCYQISDVLNEQFNDSFWLRAEIGELNVRNGHCYIEFIEKQEGGNSILAKMRANCWANVYKMLSPYFESETGQKLGAGMQVLVEVNVVFHANFGMSLNITNIDPTYTIGDMAGQRLAVIARLTADGIMNMNKMHELPLLPQRIAIVSSATAAGYGDFIHQIKSNSEGFVFYTKLFPAIMQGERSEESIIAALDQIFEQAELFDAVVIIRGGGATTDLNCFDSYELALNCAQFPLPIITGIGHLRDVSVVDMVANISLKTPTAVAEFFIEQMCFLQERIDNAELQLQAHLRNYTKMHHDQLQMLRFRLKSTINNQIQHEKNSLELMRRTIELHSPLRILQKGYTLTLLDGKPVKSAKEIEDGKTITTEFVDGKIYSVVISPK